MEDYEIIALCQARNEAALDEMHSKYGAYAKTIAYNVLGNAQDAEECVNDAYLRLWNSIPPNSPKVLVAFWGKIVRNVALNRYQFYHAKKRSGGETLLALHELEECIPDDTATQAHAPQAEITACINRFLAAQSSENRIIFVKRYWYLQPIEKIALDLHISQSKVKSSLFRTRGKLKNHLLKEEIYL